MNLRKKKDVLDDFQRNEAGEYVYVGKMHRYHGPERKRAMRALILMDLLMFGLALTGGLITAAGVIHTLYVIIPYVLTLLFVTVTGYKCISMYFAGDPMRDYNYKATAENYDIWLLAVLITACAAVVSEAVYVVLNGFDGYVAGTVLYFLCMAVIALIAKTGKDFFAGMSWTEEESEYAEKGE